MWVSAFGSRKGETSMDASRLEHVEGDHYSDPIYWLKQYQRFSVVGALADGIVHEINNPVMGIMNYAQLIEEMLQGSDDSECAVFAKEISHETERLLGLVKASFYFVGRPVSDVSTFSVESALARVYEIIKTTMRHHYIDYESHIEPSLPSLNCCEQTFSTSVLSLMLNAVEALNAKYPEDAPSKMIKLICERETGADGEPLVALTVVDWGEGYGDQNADDMLRPGYTTRKDHAGMGLAFVNDFVASCGGDVIFNRDNETTTIGMLLPADGDGGADVV